MAISTYVLVGFLRRDRRSNEAALKYLLLGAFSSGIFAYGLSLLYGLTGSTSLVGIHQQLLHRAFDPQYRPVAIVALATTLTGLLFKIAAIPFHQWAPDAYEGAPTSITGFMSVAVKAAGWAMLLRILFGSPFHPCGLISMRSVWVPILVFVSIATMTGANFAALTQTNTKRLLAYSSIAHVGYMLLGLIAGTVTETECRWYQGHPDLSARLYLHESRRLCGDHFAAASQRCWRRSRRPQRSLFPGTSRSRADAGLHAVTGWDSSAGGILGQVLHLPQPDRV